MSCQVSENPNIGPVTAQTTMIRIAKMNTHALPSTFDDCRAKTWNASRIRQKTDGGCSGLPDRLGPEWFITPCSRYVCKLRAFNQLNSNPLTPYPVIDFSRELRKTGSNS